MSYSRFVNGVYSPVDGEYQVKVTKNGVVKNLTRIEIEGGEKVEYNFFTSRLLAEQARDEYLN